MKVAIAGIAGFEPPIVLDEHWLLGTYIYI